MSCCKINTGVTGTATCAKKIIAGAGDLRIAVKCAVKTITKAVSPDVLITDVVMDDDPLTTPPGDVENVFYKFATKENTLSFEFDHTFDPATGNTNYNETVNAEVNHKSAGNFYAIDELFGKEVICILKENGADGQWIMTGIGGGMYLTQSAGSTGKLRTDNKNVTINISGDVDQRWLYIFDTDAATTEALIDSITEAA